MFAWMAEGAWVILALPLVFAVLRQGAEGFVNVSGTTARGQLPALVVLPLLAAWCGPFVGWIGLLAGRKWAWWLLVVAYGAWVLALPRLAGYDAIWGWSGVLLGLLLVVPLPVLLADQPRGWREPAAAEQAGAPGPGAARRPGRRTKQPLTLVEVLVIAAILGILAAILGPALSRASRARVGQHHSLGIPGNRGLPSQFSHASPRNLVAFPSLPPDARKPGTAIPVSACFTRNLVAVQFTRTRGNRGLPFQFSHASPRNLVAVPRFP